MPFESIGDQMPKRLDYLTPLDCERVLRTDFGEMRKDCLVDVLVVVRYLVPELTA